MRAINRQNNHCCHEMTDFLNDPRVPINYAPDKRFYFLPMTSQVKQGIFYCPWCGIKLPKDLYDEYFDTLEREYGIEPDLDLASKPGFPEEFKDDTWWKKRGL